MTHVTCRLTAKNRDSVYRDGENAGMEKAGPKLHSGGKKQDNRQTTKHFSVSEETVD